LSLQQIVFLQDWKMAVQMTRQKQGGQDVIADGIHRDELNDVL